MNILILGDIVGPSGRKALIKKLPNLIKKKNKQLKRPGVARGPFSAVR